ncbi:MAG: hypothetical protein PHN42_01575 [Bacilli bacterium]|nr:hypothetical protein [Bacilli bacterium]
MKCGMKKIILLLIVVLSIGFIPKVQAAEFSEPVKLSLSYATGNPEKVYIRSLGGYSHVYRTFLGGKTASCIDFGKAAYAGANYVSTGAVYSANTNVRKAYQLLLNESLKFYVILAQDVIWHNGVISDATLVSDLMYAYKNLTGNTLSTETAWGWVSKFRTTPAYSGKLYIWEAEIEPGKYQRFIEPTAPILKTNPKYACADGTLESTVTACVTSLTNTGVEVTAALNSCRTTYCTTPTPVTSCPGGQMVTSGSLPACQDNNETTTATYDYSSTTGSDENVHYLYGEAENVAGLSKYCKLYCEETGSITLPGGFANALTTGTNVVWPTSANTKETLFGNIFPLSFRGTKTCYLSIEDPNAPGTDCKLDPLKDYTNAYNNLVALSKQTDIDGRTNETVRTYQGASAGLTTSYCGNLGNSVPTSNGHASYYVSNNSGYYTKFSSRYNSLRSALESAAKNYDSLRQAANSYSPKTYQSYDCDTSYDSKLKKWVSTNCKWVTHNTAGYDSALNAASNAQNAYNGAKSTFESVINGAINQCQSYINTFNNVRNLDNEIAKCHNYEPTGCSDGSSSCSIYNFTSNTTLSFEDEEYSLSDSLKQVNDVSYTCDGCTVSSKMKTYDGIAALNDFYSVAQMNTLISTAQRRVLSVYTNAVSYELNSPYKYVDKETSKPLTSSTENSIDVGYNFLPLSYENEIGKKYNLILSGISFGDTSGGVPRFNVITDYVCHYTVNGTTDDCLCPDGTENAGADLFYFMKNEAMTCEDAKAKYCEATIDIPDGDKNDKYCPNDMSKKITACLNTGYSYNYCVNLICDDKVDDAYKCKNTNGVNGEMDITSCVYTKYAQGYSLNEAINECDSLVCPLTGGIKIIYRTISLENPFPGKNISKQASGFNKDVKGRYPGTNWNSLSLVQNEILNNRKTSGSSVYQKEPLYTFVLTPAIIKEIRQYNDTREADGGYSDFTLKCRDDNGTACVSSFVHDSTYGLSSGTCAYATSKNDFYECNE